jgi:hypothetical protein
MLQSSFMVVGTGLERAAEDHQLVAAQRCGDQQRKNVSIGDVLVANGGLAPAVLAARVGSFERDANRVADHAPIANVARNVLQLVPEAAVLTPAVGESVERRHYGAERNAFL